MFAATPKVTSPGSQYSVSTSPSVPHPTPAIEPLDSAVLNPPPPMDFAAVAKLLGPIQEILNESATEAMYPSPPINTPEVLSPAPSTYRNAITRGRGFSAIGDRLAQLKLDDRRFACREAHGASSCRSAEQSAIEDDESEMASISEVLSDAEKDKQGPDHTSMSQMPLLSPAGDGAVAIALGSPTRNPRIEEYLSFTSKDLPTKASISSSDAPLKKAGTTSIQTALIFNSSRDSLKSDGGVTEKSNWAEEVEDAVERTCLRLEQLAQDENATNPTKSVEEYYLERLRRLLGDDRRAHPVKIRSASKEWD